MDGLPDVVYNRESVRLKSVVSGHRHHWSGDTTCPPSSRFVSTTFTHTMVLTRRPRRVGVSCNRLPGYGWGNRPKRPCPWRNGKVLFQRRTGGFHPPSTRFSSDSFTDKQETLWVGTSHHLWVSGWYTFSVLVPSVVYTFLVLKKIVLKNIVYVTTGTGVVETSTFLLRKFIPVSGWQTPVK